MELTQEYIKSILDYNPLTGEFTWKERADASLAWNKKNAGNKAGSKQNGYIYIRVNGKAQQAHRLAILYMEGYLPKRVDHKDRVRDNNIYDNLRSCTQSQNIANITKRSDNTSGYKNVSWDKSTGKWQVTVQKDGKSIYGGTFIHKKDAVEAANELRFELFGEFALYEKYEEQP
ncbi:homing endonuclease [Bacteriophage T5-like cott162]|uniref:Homing endonuclease n=6 Tax=Epseptimavirus saus132 TaxID=2732020 RepID=A0A2K8HC59_9CAUD|nr:HNH endonuclease [Escherichia phage saus132]ASU02394.1 homing endonuclease [Bacteriophage T5-like chee130_1]ASU02700.1 homing endonuclease [Bacteriophage T5-like poul149]ASU02855.1 homing endonuclease [Bacteriophage T5-like chee158]ASU03009.1 homing endonuclease [Bacteriophage T5-like cott162]ASU03163.1 homing endonuclease [Bacteriophage T5-like saus176N]